ncbi:MAG: class I SAM-dependent methyltransferase [Myxococcota bacterium]
MREGVPSGTSFFVSFARGLGVGSRPIDPWASKWLPWWMGRLVEAPQYLGLGAHVYRTAARATSLGMIDHMVLRTEVIDAKLIDALGAGIDQVVILGAGLDARAWRIPALRDVKVYEVDHPATQRFKRSRTEDYPPPGEVRYVPVDFERERFSDALGRAGFARERPTAWIWEGVAMYLRREAVIDSLAQMTDLSAHGSALLMTYRIPNALPFGRLGEVAIPWVFSIGGEPLGATLSPDELERELAPAWRVDYDEGPRGWQQFTDTRANPSRTFFGERFAMAVRGS